MAGRARAARANHEVMRAALRDYEKAVEALRRRDLNSEERDRLEGELEREVRDRLLHLRQKSESLVQAAAERVVELSPATRRRKAVFKNTKRAAEVAAWLDGADPDTVLDFARQAMEREDHAAAAGILRVATAIDGLDASDLSGILDAGDPDFEHARSELIVTKAESAALDVAVDVAGVGPGGVTALAAVNSAAAIEVNGRREHIRDAEIVAAYEALGIERAVAPSEWPAPEPGGVMVPREPAQELPEPDAAA